MDESKLSELLLEYESLIDQMTDVIEAQSKVIMKLSSALAQVASVRGAESQDKT